MPCEVNERHRNLLRACRRGSLEVYPRADTRCAARTRKGPTTIWLTPAAHSKLQDEFDELTRRNATPAPEIEARIRELRAILRRADVSSKPDDGLVEPGMTVTVQFDADPTPAAFLLAQRGIADDFDLGQVSTSTRQRRRWGSHS